MNRTPTLILDLRDRPFFDSISLPPRLENESLCLHHHRLVRWTTVVELVPVSLGHTSLLVRVREGLRILLLFVSSSPSRRVSLCPHFKSPRRPLCSLAPGMIIPCPGYCPAGGATETKLGSCRVITLQTTVIYLMPSGHVSDRNVVSGQWTGRSETSETETLAPPIGTKSKETGELLTLDIR